MNTYKTIDIARIIGIHVNTVRLYEKCGLIPKPERLGNGYRVFTDLHIEQFRLAWAALQVEVLQNGLRKQVVDIIKVSALGNEELQRLLRFTSKGTMMTGFDDEAFLSFVEWITVLSRKEVIFELKCGLSLRERLVEP